jgi:hypothetical protein
LDRVLGLDPVCFGLLPQVEPRQTFGTLAEVDVEILAIGEGRLNTRLTRIQGVLGDEVLGTGLAFEVVFSGDSILG